MKNKKISVVREALNTASTYRVRNRQHSMSITTSNNTHNVTSGVEREIHFLRPLQKANGAPTQTSNHLQAPPEAAAAAAAPWRLTTETVYERQSDFSGRGENVTTLYAVWGRLTGLSWVALLVGIWWQVRAIIVQRAAETFDTSCVNQTQRPSSTRRLIMGESKLLKPL